MCIVVLVKRHYPYCLKMPPKLFLEHYTIYEDEYEADEFRIRRMKSIKVGENFEEKEELKKVIRSILEGGHMRNHPFINRAAWKLAEIDVHFKFFGEEYFPPYYKGESAIHVYDICGAPGGFSQYVLWRYPNAKVSGTSLLESGGNEAFVWSPLVSNDPRFRQIDGNKGGDIIADVNFFASQKERYTHIVSDGEISHVTTNEYNRKVLRMRLITSEVYIALSLLEDGGKFCFKIFSPNVPQSNLPALSALLLDCFDSVRTFKPRMSRLDSYESYVICQGYHRSSFSKYKKIFVQYFRETSMGRYVYIRDISSSPESEENEKGEGEGEGDEDGAREGICDRYVALAESNIRNLIRLLRPYQKLDPAKYIEAVKRDYPIDYLHHTQLRYSWKVFE